MASFDDWLRWLKSARKGPVALYATRGRAFAATITINDVLAGSTMSGQVRLGPDANGAPLETFTVSAPTVGTDTTMFEVTLSGSEVGALPAAVPGDGVVQLAYDLLLTPSGGDEELLFGGSFNLIGRVTE